MLAISLVQYSYVLHVFSSGLRLRLRPRHVLRRSQRVATSPLSATASRVLELLWIDSHFAPLLLVKSFRALLVVRSPWIVYPGAHIGHDSSYSAVRRYTPPFLTLLPLRIPLRTPRPVPHPTFPSAIFHESDSNIELYPLRREVHAGWQFEDS